MVTRDTSYVGDFQVNPAGQKCLKPGVQFSATNTIKLDAVGVG